MYVSAVAAAAERSLRVIYFILILVILTFASIKNNYDPGWMLTRAQRQQDLYNCLKVNDIKSPDCARIKVRAIRAGYAERKESGELDYKILKMAADGGWNLDGELGTETFPKKNEFLISEIGKRATQYSIKVVDLYTITIPLLGSSIDINDLWLISGVVMMFLLYLLRASLEQERRNICYVRDRKSEFIDVVVMSQVLSVLSVKMNPVFRVIEGAIWLTPTFLYIWLLCIDYSTIQAGQLLLEGYGLLFSVLPEFLAVVLVGYFNVRCLMSHFAIRNLIGPLLSTNPP